MPEQFTLAELSARIKQAIPAVGEQALALLQGYAFTRLMDAPAVLESIKLPNTWEDFFDLRIFGAQGEWHAWNLGSSQWGARLWKAGDQDKSLQLEREFPLWGKRVEPRENGWSLVTEANGALVLVPESAVADPVDTRDTQTILRAFELVGYDKKTGLAGIVDCVLCAVKPNPHRQAV